MLKNTPLWKQLLGAVGGASVALGLYYAYEFSAPIVTAYITNPSASETPKETASTERIARQSSIVRDTKQIAANLQDIGEQASSETSQENSNAFDERDSAFYASMLAQEQSSSSVSISRRPHPAALKSAESSSSAQSEAIVAHTPAPTLPSSGLGVWLAILGAGSGATGLLMRRKETENAQS